MNDSESGDLERFVEIRSNYLSEISKENEVLLVTLTDTIPRGERAYEQYEGTLQIYQELFDLDQDLANKLAGYWQEFSKDFKFPLQIKNANLVEKKQQAYAIHCELITYFQIQEDFTECLEDASEKLGYHLLLDTLDL